MLFNLDGKKITSIPHKGDYDRWMKCLDPNDYKKIEAELNQYIKDKIEKNEPITSGWITGPDWDGTVFEPIYTACKGNQIQAGYFFGLILFEIMINRPEKWCCGKFSVDGREIGSTTYFISEGGI